MREATLGGLSDLDAVRPRKAGSARARSSSKPASRAGKGRFARFRSHATVTIATAGFAAILVGILVNATMLQKGHHPAPLFGTAPGGAAPAARPVARVETPPAPAPVAGAATAAAADDVPAAVSSVPASRPAPQPAGSRLKGATHAKPVDRIAALLGETGEAGAAPLHPVGRRASSPAAHAVRPGQTPGPAAQTAAGARQPKPAT